MSTEPEFNPNKFIRIYILLFLLVLIAVGVGIYFAITCEKYGNFIPLGGILILNAYLAIRGIHSSLKMKAYIAKQMEARALDEVIKEDEEKVLNREKYTEEEQKANREKLQADCAKARAICNELLDFFKKK